MDLTQPLKEEFIHFLETPAKRFSRNLRDMVILYLISDDCVEEDLLHDIFTLFKLLDVIEQEQGKISDVN